MKKIFLILAVITIFCSCENKDNELTSLAGTTWISDEDGGSIELRFGTSHVVLNFFDYLNDYEFEAEGTYTFDPPKVTVFMQGVFLGKSSPGIIKGDILSIELLAGDLGFLAEFKKQ